MKRSLAATTGALVLVALTAGCGNDTTETSTATASAPTSTTTETRQAQEWPTATTLVTVLNQRGYECTDPQDMSFPLRGTGENKAMCKTGASNGGGIYITVSTFDTASEMESAAQLNKTGNGLRSGSAVSALVYGANWLVQCPDGGPGGQGEVACQAAQIALGGEIG